jgi:hypothetical protein
MGEDSIRTDLEGGIRVHLDSSLPNRVRGKSPPLGLSHPLCAGQGGAHVAKAHMVPFWATPFRTLPTFHKYTGLFQNIPE